MNFWLELLNSLIPKDISDMPDQRVTIETQNLVDETYIEYQKFMCVSDLPKYDLHLKSKTGGTKGGVRYDKERGIYNLYITNDIFREKDYKQILYHEFTHILDGVYLNWLKVKVGDVLHIQRFTLSKYDSYICLDAKILMINL